MIGLGMVRQRRIMLSRFAKELRLHRVSKGIKVIKDIEVTKGIRVTKVLGSKVIKGIRGTKEIGVIKAIKVTTERTATGVFKATKDIEVFKVLQTEIKGTKVTKVPRVIKVL